MQILGCPIVAQVCAERGSVLLLQSLFLGRSDGDGWRKTESVMFLMQGSLATGTYLSSALPWYIQAGGNDSQYQHVLMPRRKEGRSKFKTSFLDLFQRQQIGLLLNYLWCYLGGIYRLWSCSLLEAHSLNCINLVSLSVSHMSFHLSHAWNAFYSPLLVLWFICIIPKLLESEELLFMVFGWFRFTAASLVLHAVPNMHRWELLWGY